jgi:hypothetical protein
VDDFDCWHRVACSRLGVRHTLDVIELDLDTRHGTERASPANLATRRASENSSSAKAGDVFTATRTEGTCSSTGAAGCEQHGTEATVSWIECCARAQCSAGRRRSAAEHANAQHAHASGAG